MQLEERISTLERQVFGDELGSRIQQQRKIADEILQINSQIHRAVSNRENLSKLMQQIELLMELLALERSSQMLGTESKASAILAAEPLIRETYSIVKNIDVKKVQEAMNSEAIRSLSSLQGQLAKLRLGQIEQESTYEDISCKIKGVEEAINIVLSSLEYIISN